MRKCYKNRGGAQFTTYFGTIHYLFRYSLLFVSTLIYNEEKIQQKKTNTLHLPLCTGDEYLKNNIHNYWKLVIHLP